MQKNKKRGFWSVISPFFVYYFMTMAVEVVFISALMSQKMPEILKNQPADPSQLSGYIMEEYMPYFMEEFMKNILLVTAAAALCTIPVYLLMFYKDRRFEAGLGIPAMPKAPLWKYILIPLIGITASVGMNNLLILSNLRAYSSAYRQVSEGLYTGSLGLQLIGVGIIVPIAEELMFRGLIFRRMLYMTRRKNAMLYSAIVFGIYHGNLVQGIYGFVLGYLCVWIYERYGSLKAPILFHIAANVTSVIATKYGLFKWIFRNPVQMGIVTVLCAAAASSLFVLIRNLCGETAAERETS